MFLRPSKLGCHSNVDQGLKTFTRMVETLEELKRDQNAAPSNSISEEDVKTREDKTRGQC